MRIIVRPVTFAEATRGTRGMAGGAAEQGRTGKDKKEISFHCNLAFVGS